MKNKTKMLSIVLAIVMILTSVSIGVPTFAASKPSATQITSIKVVDNGFRASGSDKYLEPFCVGCLQCLNGRRRDTVSFKTDQRSVYVKK